MQLQIIAVASTTHQTWITSLPIATYEHSQKVPSSNRLVAAAYNSNPHKDIT